MPESTIITLAAIGGVIALACAIACACASVLLARSARSAALTPPRPERPLQPPTGTITVLPAPPQPQPPQVVVMLPPMPATTSVAPGPTSSGLVLEGRYPHLGRTLGTWLQQERDELERVRIARDLGRLGDADAARALLDGVRSGAITPTVAADNLQRGGFDAGITVAAALRDSEPRVRALASSLVGRTAALQRTDIEDGPAR